MRGRPRPEGGLEGRPPDLRTGDAVNLEQGEEAAGRAEDHVQLGVLSDGRVADRPSSIGGAPQPNPCRNEVSVSKNALLKCSPALSDTRSAIAADAPLAIAAPSL